jgi:hypothetical protein
MKVKRAKLFFKVMKDTHITKTAHIVRLQRGCTLDHRPNSEAVGKTIRCCAGKMELLSIHPCA